MIWLRNFLWVYISKKLTAYPVYTNFVYWWDFLILLFVCLVTQVLTGIFLAIYYTDAASSFATLLSIEYIAYSFNYNWLARYVYANGVSLFFIYTYCSAFGVLYYNPYRKPNDSFWCIGALSIIILITQPFVLIFCLLWKYRPSIILNFLGLWFSIVGWFFFVSFSYAVKVLLGLDNKLFVTFGANPLPKIANHIILNYVFIFIALLLVLLLCFFLIFFLGFEFRTSSWLPTFLFVALSMIVFALYSFYGTALINYTLGEEHLCSFLGFHLLQKLAVPDLARVSFGTIVASRPYIGWGLSFLDLGPLVENTYKFLKEEYIYKTFTSDHFKIVFKYIFDSDLENLDGSVSSLRGKLKEYDLSFIVVSGRFFVSFLFFCMFIFVWVYLFVYLSKNSNTPFWPYAIFFIAFVLLCITVAPLDLSTLYYTGPKGDAKALLSETRAWLADQNRFLRLALRATSSTNLRVEALAHFYLQGSDLIFSGLLGDVNGPYERVGGHFTCAFIGSDGTNILAVFTHSQHLRQDFPWPPYTVDNSMTVVGSDLTTRRALDLRLRELRSCAFVANESLLAAPSDQDLRPNEPQYVSPVILDASSLIDSNFRAFIDDNRSRVNLRNTSVAEEYLQRYNMSVRQAGLNVALKNVAGDTVRVLKLFDNDGSQGTGLINCFANL